MTKAHPLYAHVVYSSLSDARWTHWKQEKQKILCAPDFTSNFYISYIYQYLLIMNLGLSEYSFFIHD